MPIYPTLTLSSAFLTILMYYIVLPVLSCPQQVAEGHAEDAEALANYTLCVIQLRAGGSG